MSLSIAAESEAGPQAAGRSLDRLLNRKELAERLSMSARGVQELTRRRAIPVIRLGRKCLRYDFARVKAALEKFEIKAAV